MEAKEVREIILKGGLESKGGPGRTPFKKITAYSAADSSESALCALCGLYKTLCYHLSATAAATAQTRAAAAVIALSYFPA